MPRVGQIALDWTVLVAVLAASTGVAVIVALVPALLAARTNLQPLLRQSRGYGRTFTAADGLTAPRVAIVNETFARRYFDDPSRAVGRRLVQHGGGSEQLEVLETVAVVGDVRHRGLDQAVIPEMFRPLRQTFMFPMAMVVRSAGPPEQLAAAVRQAGFEIDPVVPVAEL